MMMSVVNDTMFKNYFTDLHFDEMFTSEMEVNPIWKSLHSNIMEIGLDGLKTKQNDLNWYLAENGVTYNVYNDPQGLKRPWNLNAIPHVIHQTEWEKLERGLKQRAEILNFILSDIYGKRELIKNGIIPQEVIYSHRGFLRQCDQIKYNTNKHLLMHSSDMGRGPDGQMWIINDRTQAPSGMGYTLENRTTLSRVLPELSANIYVKRLSEYFQHFHELLIKSSPKKNDNPNIVILTPGPHNETYFEHSYLASFLGYSLVQGNDLIARDGFLWMKTLKGLRQVDVVLRRVDDLYTDPLELRDDSHLGVAGLLDVVRRKNVSIVNPIGCRVLENPGLIPFMGRVSKYFLNEELILPQIASWWCGQETERKYVLEHLSELIIKRIDRSTSSSIFFGYKMSYSELDELHKQIIDRPYRFVAQEKISFSTTPTLANNNLEPRNSVWRSFAVAHQNEYSIMPGGLMRVASEKGNINVSNQSGGGSKDVWVITDTEEHNKQNYTWSRRSNISISGLDELPSLTAENLFWAGRYVARTLTTARFIRMVLKQMNYSHLGDKSANAKILETLYQAITLVTDTHPGFIPDEKSKESIDPSTEIFSVLFDVKRPGSLAFTLSMFSNSYYSIRNLWSTDMWRVFDRIDTIWSELQSNSDKNIRTIIMALDQLITRLIAFMGLVEECILIEQGLLLYFIGLNLEQSLLTISKTQALLTIKHNDTVEYELLEALLTSHESLNIYRYSYRSYLSFENVMELILLDLKYPRSIAYQLNQLNKDLALLPHPQANHDLTLHEKYIFEAFSKLRLAKSDELAKVEADSQIREQLALLLSQLNTLIINTSLVISNTYFSHTYKQDQLVHQNFQV